MKIEKIQNYVKVFGRAEGYKQGKMRGVCNLAGVKIGTRRNRG